MPTELRKSIVRRCAEAHDHRHKRLVVALEPGDVISFREERSRKRFTAPLSRVFRQVVIWNVEAERALKKGAKQCVKKS